MTTRTVPTRSCYIGVGWPKDGWIGEPPERKRTDERFTLAVWLMKREPRNACYLVNAGNHWIAVRGNKIADTYNSLTTIRRFKGRRKRIRSVVEIERAA